MQISSKTPSRFEPSRGGNSTIARIGERSKEHAVFLYAKWTPRQHLAAVTRLVKAIVDTATLGVAASVSIDDFSKFAPRPTPQAQIRTAYRVAASWCIGRVKGWLRNRGILEPVAYIFEAGDKGQGYLNEVVSKLSASATFRQNMRIESVTFEEKRKRPSLQAADILAYESNAQSLRDIGIETRPSRQSLIALQKGLRHERILFNADGLQKYKEWMKSSSNRLTPAIFAELSVPVKGSK